MVELMVGLMVELVVGLVVELMVELTDAPLLLCSVNGFKRGSEGAFTCNNPLLIRPPPL